MRVIALSQLCVGVLNGRLIFLYDGDRVVFVSCCTLFGIFEIVIYAPL